MAWADPEGCDPHYTTREVQDQAFPEQAETEALLAAWHAAFGSREVQVRDLERLCQKGTCGYNEALADAVAGLGLAPPRSGAAINTRSMGVWLTAHAERPGPYVLHKGTAPRKWYVRKRPPEVGRSQPYKINLPLRDEQDGYVINFLQGDEKNGRDSDRWTFVEVDVTKENDERKALLSHGNLTVGAADDGALLMVYNPMRLEDDGSIAEAITQDASGRSHLASDVRRYTASARDR